MEAFVGRPGPIRAVLLLVGATATASQVLCIRELLIVFHGTELFLGIVLGVWLLLEALGCHGSRRWADATSQPLRQFAILLALLGAAALWGVVAPRAFRAALDLPPGEALGILHVLLASVLVLAPVALLDGALFPLGYRCLALADPRRDSAAHAYLFQALGACGAGALLVLWLLSALTSLELAIGLLILDVAGAVLCTARARGRPPARSLAVAASALAPVLALLAAAPCLEQASVGLLWRGHQVARTANSMYANIAVLRQEGQITFLANGIAYATLPTPDPALQDLAHLPLLAHPAPERVLVIGPALGGLVRELAAHAPHRLDYAEPDPLVLETFREFPAPLTVAEMQESALQIHPVEGRLLLKTAGEPYDVILVNLPMPSTLVLNRYYTTDFFALARSRLRQDGLLALQLPGSETVLSPELVAVHQTVFASLRQVFPHVRPLPGSPTIYLASEAPAVVALDPANAAARVRARGIAAPALNDAALHYRTDPARRATHEQRLLDEDPAPLNRDVAPWGVFASLLAVHRSISPEAVSVIAAVGSVTARYALWGVSALATALLLLRALLGPGLALGWAMASTGFVGMQLSILLIFLFQIAHAHLYHSIGLLTALFMLGAAVGALCLGWPTRARLLLLEASILGLLTATIQVVGGEPATPRGTIFVLMTLAGLLTGAEFPVVSGLMAGTGTGGVRRVALVYALDLLGAVGGALLTAALLVPILGLGATLHAALILKASSSLLCALEYARTRGQRIEASAPSG